MRVSYSQEQWTSSANIVKGIRRQHETYRKEQLNLKIHVSNSKTVFESTVRLLKIEQNVFFLFFFFENKLNFDFSVVVNTFWFSNCIQAIYYTSLCDF